jgi:RNA polymerase sigma factor (TIGR02999 family)
MTRRAGRPVTPALRRRRLGQAASPSGKVFVVRDAIELVHIHLIRVPSCPRLVERLFSPFMTEVTRILSAIEQGDPHAAERLLPLVYDELRKLAAQKLALEKPGQTLQATALVHEAYLQLVGAGAERDFNGRRHFLAAAAQAMRHILVEQARRKHRLKRGGRLDRCDLSESAGAAPEDSDEVVAVDEALDRLAAVDPRTAELVRLRYFAGLPIPEVAAALNISPRTADRLWAYARAWLRDAISGHEQPSS